MVLNRSHYVSVQGLREAHLYSHRHLPGWVGKLDLEVRFVVHAGKGLFRRALDGAHGRWNPADQSFSSGELPRTLTRKSWGQWNWPLILSSPERAILEFLHEVPERETFDQADKFMEGLRTLSPHRVQRLLEDCISPGHQLDLRPFRHSHIDRSLDPSGETAWGQIETISVNRTSEVLRRLAQLRCSAWLHETASGRLDPSYSGRFLKVAIHPAYPDSVPKLHWDLGPLTCLTSVSGIPLPNVRRRE